MKTWDVIIIGGGIVGLSLAIELRKHNSNVLIVERGEPGREASHAAGGMLVDCASETPPALRSLASASARMYPGFVHELQDESESGVHIDFRDDGAISFEPSEHSQGCGQPLDADGVAQLEPAVASDTTRAVYLKERSVDPRGLIESAIQAAKHRGVDIISGNPVQRVVTDSGRVSGVSTGKTAYSAPVVVNCAGAWSGQISPLNMPTRPRKGQMFSVVGGPKLRHVLRTRDVYIIPRSNGRIVIGATVEDVGFDKQTDPATIQRLRRAAIQLVPALAGAQIHEDWAGLRPGTPDDLPILGSTEINGYFAATGHFRDGILLAPVTARVIAQLITGQKPDHDLSAFSPTRFRNQGR